MQSTRPKGFLSVSRKSNSHLNDQGWQSMCLDKEGIMDRLNIDYTCNSRSTSGENTWHTMPVDVRLQPIWLAVIQPTCMGLDVHAVECVPALKRCGIQELLKEVWTYTGTVHCLDTTRFLLHNPAVARKTSTCHARHMCHYSINRQSLSNILASVNCNLQIPITFLPNQRYKFLPIQSRFQLAWTLKRRTKALINGRDTICNTQ